jgi:hypothetical protein
MAARGLRAPFRIAAAAAVLTLGALAAVLVLALVGGDERERSLLRPIRARATLAPAVHLFGDRVLAEIVVTLDPDQVDPASVTLDSDFDPYSIIGRSRQQADSEGVVVQRHRFTLTCLRLRCLPGRTQRLFPLEAAAVRYRLRTGPSERLSVEWPRLTATSRLDPEELAERPNELFRADVSPPAATYRVEPGTLVGILVGAALLLVVVAAALLSPELRRLLLLRARRRDPLAGMTSLQRALKLVERSLASGTADEQRKAIDLLARELRRAGDDELSAAARQLAWSARAPAEADLAAIEDAERTIGAAR